MNEHNLLKHWDFEKIDKSNFWTDGGPILDIPVFPPDTISFNGIKTVTPYEYKDLNFGLFHTDTAYFLCGHDLKSRYLILKIQHESCKFIYKYGGRSFPQARTYSGYSAYLKNMYVTGGLVDGRPFNDMWVFNIDKEQWDYLGLLPSTRWDHNITADPEGIWLFGGRNKSDIDNAEMRLNDLWFFSFEKKIWTQYDQMALLPHGEAAVLGKDNTGWIYIYYVESRELWRTTSTDTTEFIARDLFPPGASNNLMSSDLSIWKDANYTYLAIILRPNTGKGYLEGFTKEIYRWDGYTSFVKIIIEDVGLLKASLACVAYNADGNLIQLKNTSKDALVLYHPTLNLVPNKPPENYFCKCETTHGEFFVTQDHLCHWNFDTFHCTYFDYKNALNGSALCQDPENEDIILYEPIGKILRISLSDFSMTEETVDPDNVHAGEIPKRTFPLISKFKNKIWIIGGYIDKVMNNDFDTFDLTTRVMSKVNMLDKPPTHRRHLFLYNRRIWLLTRDVDSLWCFDDNYQIWKQLKLRDVSTLELPFGGGTVSQRENFLIISGQKSPTIQISLDSRRVTTFPDLKYQNGHHFAAINKSFLLVSNSITDPTQMAPGAMPEKSPYWVYIYDVSTMRTATHDTPPSFMNTNEYNHVMGIPVMFPVMSRSFITTTIDEIGQKNCLYKDLKGNFWFDQNFGRYYDFDEEEGLYNPEKDYGFAGDAPETLVRWMPSYKFNENEAFSGTVVLEFQYGGENFVLESGRLHRMWFSDNYKFSHNVPMWAGCSAGINSRGELFILGGTTGESLVSSETPKDDSGYADVKNGSMFPHKEVYDQDGFDFVHTPPSSEEIQYRSHLGFLIYDVNYLAAQSEYLNDIPDFYERFDYDLARDYLVDMKKRLMSEARDEFNSEKVGSIQERVYKATQDIIDDLAVRYVTGELGRRPYDRNYSIYGQIGDMLYIGGGVTIVDHYPPTGAPFRTFELNDLRRPENPANEEEENFNPSSISNRGMYKFDMINRRWSWVCKLPMGKVIDETQGGSLYCSTMTLRPNTTDFYVVGGATEASFKKIINEIWIFKTANNTWEKIEYVPDTFKPRHSASCVWLDDDRLFISYGYITYFIGPDTGHTTFVRGDQWILNVNDKIMYKVGQDLTKKFAVIPGSNEEDVLKLLFFGENTDGAHRDLTECLRNMHKDYDFVIYESLCKEATEELTSILIEHLNLPSTGGADNVNSKYLTTLLINNYDYLKSTYRVYQEELIGAEFFDTTRILHGDMEGLHTTFIKWVVDKWKTEIFLLSMEYLTEYPDEFDFCEALRVREAKDIYEATSPVYRKSMDYYYRIAPFSEYLHSLPYTDAEMKQLERGETVRELYYNYSDYLESVRIYRLFQLTGTSDYFRKVYKESYHIDPIEVVIIDTDRYSHSELIRKLQFSKSIPITFLNDLYLSEVKRVEKYYEDLKIYHKTYDKLIQDWAYAEDYSKKFAERAGGASRYLKSAFTRRGYNQIPKRPPVEPVLGNMTWKDTLLILRAYVNIFDTSASEYQTNNLFFVDVGLTTGRPKKVQAIYTNSQISLKPEDLIDLFTYKDKSLWLSAFTDNLFGFWRFFKRVTDADYDLDFLAIDMPTSAVRPLATAYNNNDKMVVVYDWQNIYELDLRLAMYNPDADYWHRKAPAVNVQNSLNNQMKSTYFDGMYHFFTKEGRLLTYNPDTMLWKILREDSMGLIGGSIKVGPVYNVVIDGKELYYLGDNNTSRYFDLVTSQGDRFMIDSSKCEHDDRNVVLPKVSVQRNMVFGFDENNNLIYAWTRKHGVLDVSYNLHRYFKIKEILLSVDQNSLDFPATVYAETATGSRIFHSVEPFRERLWSFDDITRRYYYESLYSLLPDQYIRIPIDDTVSNLNIVFTPPANESSYIVRLNGVLIVPEDTDKLLPTELQLSCPESTVVGLRSFRRDTSRWRISSDNPHIQVKWGENNFSENVEVSIPPGGFITVDLRCLKLGEIGNILAIDLSD